MDTETKPEPEVKHALYYTRNLCSQYIDKPFPSDQLKEFRSYPFDYRNVTCVQCLRVLIRQLYRLR